MRFEIYTLYHLFFKSQFSLLITRIKIEFLTNKFMETYFKIILIIHVVFGGIGLLAGTINIIRKKGDKPHLIVGKVFLFAMIINAFAGFTLSILHDNIFLLIVAVFSFYMVCTGQRILSLKNLLKNQKPATIDYFLTYGMLLFGVGFMLKGVYLLINHINFGIVCLVLGSISILMVRTDLKLFKGNTNKKNYWLLVHLQRMIGAYIAAVTAFIVTNDKYNLGIIGWLLPTVILVPLIVKWSRKNAVLIK